MILCLCLGNSQYLVKVKERSQPRLNMEKKDDLRKLTIISNIKLKTSLI